MKHNIYFMLLTIILLAGCKKEDIYDMYSPEVLYMQESSPGKGDWAVSPDVKGITLGEGENTWTVRARISSPNELAEVILCTIGADGSETGLHSWTDFELRPTVFNVVYELTGITANTTVKITGIDKKGHETSRNFSILIPSI